MLDASWSRERDRRRAREAAEDVRAALVEVRCAAPPGQAAERVRRRLAGPSTSDATPEVAQAMAARFEDWPGSATVVTDRSPAACAEDVLDLARRARTGT